MRTEGKSTRAVLLEHGGVEHALDLFTEGRAKFTKRRTPLALLALLNALSAVADGTSNAHDTTSDTANAQ